MIVRHRWVLPAAVMAAALVTAPAAAADPVGPSGQWQFQPIPAEQLCTPSSPTTAAQPFVLPPGYAQQVVASEPSYPDVPDMQTQNETGQFAGRFLYRTHETRPTAR